ncbi:MAG: RNA polymerase sigma factor [Planctomycetota bacterium]
MPNKSWAEKAPSAPAVTTAFFNRTILEHRGALVKYLYRRTRDFHIAEDLCQETITRAYFALSTLDSPDRIKNWLYSIAYHIAVDWMRGRIAGMRIAHALKPHLPMEGTGIGADLIMIQEEETASRERQVRLLWGKVRQLPPIYREIFELRYGKWCPIAQIARQTGIPEGNVKVRLFRARQMLLRLFENSDISQYWIK